MGTTWQPYIRTAARAGIGLFFVLAGLSKLGIHAAIAARMEATGLSPAYLLLPLTIALEIGAGLLVIMGRRGAGLAAIALALFTLATNWFFHRFWELDGPMFQLELSLFFKNLAIACGLMLIAATLRSDSPNNSDRGS